MWLETQGMGLFKKVAELRLCGDVRSPNQVLVRTISKETAEFMLPSAQSMTGADPLGYF